MMGTGSEGTKVTGTGEIKETGIEGTREIGTEGIIGIEENHLVLVERIRKTRYLPNIN